MLLTALFLGSSLGAPAEPFAEPAPTACTTHVHEASVHADDKGKLPWFKGTWEELLAEAQRTKSIIFVDFWADW